MTSRFIDRRALLALGASLALGGCATSMADSGPAVPVIRGVRVTGHANLYIVQIGPYVQHHLVQQLGARYQPGARDGATVVVDLTDIELPTSSDSFGPFGSDSSDVLDSRVTVLSPSGAVIKSFPLLTSTFSVDASDQIPFPTPRRYNSLAYTYSYWLARKI